MKCFLVITLCGLGVATFSGMVKATGDLARCKGNLVIFNSVVKGVALRHFFSDLGNLLFVYGMILLCVSGALVAFGREVGKAAIIMQATVLVITSVIFSAAHGSSYTYQWNSGEFREVHRDFAQTRSFLNYELFVYLGLMSLIPTVAFIILFVVLIVAIIQMRWAGRGEKEKLIEKEDDRNGRKTALIIAMAHCIFALFATVLFEIITTAVISISAGFTIYAVQNCFYCIIVLILYFFVKRQD